MSDINCFLFVFLQTLRLASATEANYVDATKLVVCHNKRIKNQKVFKDFAKRGKSSTGLGSPAGFLALNCMLSLINVGN